jgi:ABC-type nickel/cobalt efflux system permease component RcnA
VKLILALLTLSIASAHPMGNFSVSHYSGITINRNSLDLRYLLDVAEIPTFQEMQQSDPHTAAYLTKKSAELANGLHLTLNGKPLVLRVIKQNAIFPPGAGNLPTMKLGFLYRAQIPESCVSGKCALDYRDDNLPDSTGWKEVVVKAGQEIKLIDSTAPSEDRSGELSNYPTDLLNSPPQVLQAQVVFQLPAVTVKRQLKPTPPSPLPQPQAKIEVQPAIEIQPNVQPTPRNRFTELMATQKISFGFGLLAALIAAGLGALHALEPGHGKTIVAAYLVGSRGTTRHALLLGTIVTISHTAGVYLLGGVTLYAQKYILPERLYPLFGVLSGILIAGMGCYLFLQRYMGAEFAHTHDHGVRPKQLLVLGVTGGIVPCPAALVVLLSAIALHRVAFGLYLIVAFSAGLAAVLIAMGIMAVQAGKMASRVHTEGPLIQRWLPLGSAAMVSLFGCAIAFQGLTAAGVLNGLFR